MITYFNVDIYDPIIFISSAVIAYIIVRIILNGSVFLDNVLYFFIWFIIYLECCPDNLGKLAKKFPLPLNPWQDAHGEILNLMFPATYRLFVIIPMFNSFENIAWFA